MKPCFVVLVFLLLQAAAFASTWYVPDDFSTIQDAIEAAVEGDTIIVRPAVYRENIDFLGKDIVVESELGPEMTVINGMQLGSVVTFDGGEGPAAVLVGFTISNGTGTQDGDDLHGGGIYCNGASPTIRRNIIRLNSALPWGSNWEVGRGGGIFCYDSVASIEENTISENGAETGGGIYSDESSLSIINNTITSNITSMSGAGLRCGTALISGNVVTGNKADSSAGGIMCTGSTVTSNIITGNTALSSAGGISCSGSIVTDNIISGNSSEYGSGGGISDGSGTVVANTITGNSAGSSGGGMYGWDTTSRFNMIVGNSAADGGGFAGESTMTDCLIAGNLAWDTGGGIRGTGGAMVVTNCTIHENTAERGGGISVYSDSYTIVTNSVIWNDNAQVGTEIYLDDDDPYAHPILSITSSNVEGGQLSVHVNPDCTLLWGTGMIDADPLFVQPEEGDYHLTYDSPCRDAGLITAPSLPDTDFEGDPRVAGAAPDMGADEFHPHVYNIGSVEPGGFVDLRVVGMPLTAPVTLVLGSGIKEPPVPTIYGDLYLESPLRIRDLDPIPAGGVLIQSAPVPQSWTSGEEHPLQVLLGPRVPGSLLTNLLILTVE